MKRFVKGLLLILLAAAIILGTAWYLLEYDTDFTHDLLLEGARFFEKNNQHVISTYLYDAAYKYGNSIEEISLELADYYASLNNYAKVEETLMRAISDGGGVDIYIALSQAFVHQDKLLDALKLIQNVSNPTIRNQLEALRPAAPVPDVPAGHYNEYLSVSLQAQDGNIYVAGTQIPSIRTDAYTEPIVLETGETALFAITVGTNGLVSPVTQLRYTIKGVVEAVVFADKEMEIAIRKASGIPEGITVYTNDLWSVTSFVIPVEARSYADMKYLPYLTELSVPKGHDSLAFIEDLESLTKLTIRDTAIDDATLQMILRHTELTSLTLRNCNLSSVSGMEALTKLTYLDLGENVLRNLAPISNITGLQVLYLDHNAVVALDDLQLLTNLQELDLSYNSITNLKPLGSLTALEQLILRNNMISDISALGKLTTLTHLDLSFNKLTAITGLATCVNLQELLITDNQITSLSPLAKHIKLQSLDFSNNKVTALPSWNKNCLLYSLNGSYNKISNVAPLSGLANLNMLNLDYNDKISNISSLAKCPNLGMLSVYGTKVKDISAFAELEITIYYDPT